MKKPISTIIAAAFFLFCSTGSHGQTAVADTKKVSLINTEQFAIVSESVKGENYAIQVGLPANYKQSKKTYDVLYVLDGDMSFGMTKEIINWLVWSGEMRDVIVVGISYGRGTAVWWQKRSRDFTQYRDTVYYYYPNAGGADSFLNFMRNELFPMINARYRTNQDSTAIMGVSFGALLSSYALFSHPDMFKKYIIISPSLFWNNNSILNTEADYFRTHKDLNKSVYLAYGTLDDKDWTINPTNEFIKAVQGHSYAGFKFATEVFKGETHISVYPMAMTHALKLLFKL
jgi:uncharacterized protein